MLKTTSNVAAVGEGPATFVTRRKPVAFGNESLPVGPSFEAMRAGAEVMARPPRRQAVWMPVGLWLDVMRRSVGSGLPQRALLEPPASLSAEGRDAWRSLVRRYLSPEARRGGLSRCPTLARVLGALA